MDVQAFLNSHGEKSAETLERYREVVKTLETHFQRPVESLTREEVRTWLLSKKPGTHNAYLSIVTHVAEFLHVDWVSDMHRRKTAESITVLEDQHVDWLLDGAINLRDKCLISVAFEIGFRRDELASVRIQDVIIDQYGYTIGCPRSKTRPRRTRGIRANAVLGAWLNQHPRRSDPTAPLFCNFGIKVGSHLGDPLPARSIARLFREVWNRARKLHPTLPHVHAHLARHHSATQMAAKGMSDRLLMQRYGWKSPQMAARYVHLAGGEEGDKFLELSGVVKPKGMNPRDFAACPSCGAKNLIKSTFCDKCGSPLDPGKQEEKLEMKAYIQDLISKALDSALKQRSAG